MKIKWGMVASGLLLMLLSLFIADPAMAAEVFQAASGDTSSAQLIDPLSGSGKIAGLFGNFNAAVLFLGGILTAYGMLTSIAQTAHDGEMLGRRFSSLWVPIRVSLGIAAIVPVGSGYCVAQQVIIYVAQSGVAAASGIWGQYVEADQSELAKTSPLTEISGVRELALSLLKSHFCTLNYQTVAASDTDNALNLEKNIKVIDFGDGQFSFGTDKEKMKCGSYIIPDYAQDATGIGAAQQTAFLKLNKRMLDLATKIYTTSTDPDAKGDPKDNAAEINNAIKEYTAIVSYAAQSYITTSQMQTKIEAKQASIQGWIMAGAYSSSKGKAVATATEVSSHIPKAAATAAPPSLAGAVATPNKENSNWLDSVSDKVSDMWNAGKQIVNTSVNAAMDMINDPNMIVSYAKEPFMPLAGALKGIMNGTGDPISNVQVLGGAAIEVAALLTAAAIALGVFTTTGGLALLGLAGVLFSFGAINYFFLPIMPALYYYSAVIGWYVLFVECLIAAPIWALMHIRFDGEGMVGSASSGYKIILNMFLRPSLITIAYGIALGSLEFLVSGWNQVFASAVAANFDLSATSLKPFFIMSAEFIVYTVTMIGIIYQVLKLITHIPEAITKWIDGGHDGFGSSTGETMHRVGHSGALSAAGAGMAVASQMGRGGSGGGGGDGDGKKPGGKGDDDKPKGNGVVDIVPRTGGDSAMPDKAPLLGSVEKSYTHAHGGSSGEGSGGKASESSSGGDSTGSQSQSTSREASSNSNGGGFEQSSQQAPSENASVQRDSSSASGSSMPASSNQSHGSTMAEPVMQEEPPPQENQVSERK